MDSKRRIFIHDILNKKIFIPAIIEGEKYHQITMEEILNDEY